MTTETDAGTDWDDSILVKSLQLRSIDDLRRIKEDLEKGRTVIILKVTPLAQKNLEELRTAIEKLYGFVMALGGDIARLGDERIVITPPGVRICREQGRS